MMREVSPKISVIVPVYNVERCISRCIDSILSQNFSDFELLLIDDGSKDKSGDICDEYAQMDKRIRAFHKENGGASSARNFGLDKVKGKYICFCDADDWVESNWLKSLCSDIFNYDMVITGFNVIRQEKLEGKKIMPIELEDKLQIIKYLEQEDVSGYLWCKCFKKQIIDKYKIRFNEKYVIWEDLDFIYRYWCHIDLIKLNREVTYNYFMPDLGSKYASKISFECCASLLSSICHLFHGKDNSIYAKYLNAAKNCLKNDIKSFSCIKSISEIVKYFIIK